ncbi:MAG: hypothetical protein R6V58_11315, partial [Planctomycetota bacterium]
LFTRKRDAHGTLRRFHLRCHRRALLAHAGVAGAAPPMRLGGVTEGLSENTIRQAAFQNPAVSTRLRKLFVNLMPDDLPFSRRTFVTLALFERSLRNRWPARVGLAGRAPLW